MVKKSRLRVQKESKGRRVVLYAVLTGVLFCCSYYAVYHYGWVDDLKEIVLNAKKSLGPGAFVRGVIYDRNLKQFAFTKERVAVYVRTREIDSITDTAIALASVLSLDSNKLIERLEGGALRVWVAEDISTKEEEEVKRLGLSGVYLQKDQKRYYPNREQAAHLIGFVEDGIGLSGVEYHYDRLLAKRKLEQGEGQITAHAQDLVLTIDLKIQTIVEDMVRDIVGNRKRARAAAYLVESGTGEIIAGAQYPSFDPNSFTNFSRNTMENLFFSPIFLPDDFRLFFRDCAALGDGTIGPMSQGTWPVYAADKRLGRQLQLWEGLQLSENTRADFFTVKEGSSVLTTGQFRLGNEEFDFGLIPEVTTPMNLLVAFSVLLNGPFQRSPHVVKKIFDTRSGAEVLVSSEQGLDSAGENNISFTASSEITGLFEANSMVRQSSSFYFRDDIVVAEKQTNGFYKMSLNDITFLTVPAGESELNMLVVFQDRPDGVYGRDYEKVDVVGIVDKKIQRIAVLQMVAGSIEDVHEPEFLDTENYQESGVVLDIESVTDNEVVDVFLPREMPDLRGISLRKSLRMLKGLPLSVSIEGSGWVVKQTPPPGTPLEKVTSCRIILERQKHIRPAKISEDVRNKEKPE